nr:MAG: hypothetical protein DIU57_17220 [Pseudomonadota bacterium]
MGHTPQEPKPHTLDEIMIAMDVVDTLRHREELVRRELDDEGREAELIARLREIYREQGIEVPDRVLEQGVKALKDQRFVYTPPPPSWKRTVLELWAQRDKVGKRILKVLLILLLLAGLAYFALIRPAQEARRQALIEATETLPRSIRVTHSDIQQIATEEAARSRADALLADGERAIRDGDVPEMRRISAELQQLRDTLSAEYTLRIVSEPGQVTGFWRRPPGLWSQRSYYLVVEPITPDGRRLSLPVRDEVTGETQTVSQFGVRVPRETYEAVAEDKRQHGIVQRNEFGVKRRGRTQVEYLMPFEGGTVTSW